MSHELICTWLGLPAGEWPPDHYRLLGLSPGETNVELIEQRAHQRLDSLRRYQMMHPEPATEAMNRLAQALICLTEPAAKKKYDEALFGSSSPAVGVQTLARAETMVHSTSDTGTLLRSISFPAPPGTAGNGSKSNGTNGRTSATPPPLPRLPPPLPPLPASVSAAAPNGSRAAPPPLPPAPPKAKPAPPAEKVDPILEVARSGKARRGLGTRRALVQRRLHTRRLLHAWESLESFLNLSRRRLSKATADELDQLLAGFSPLLRHFPPPLGQAGQPGFLVLSLVQQELLETFQELNPGQREALYQDWEAGHKLLLAHRDFLAQESETLRRLTLSQRLARSLHYLLIDNPGMVLLLLALVALNVAVWRGYVLDWFLTP